MITPGCDTCKHPVQHNLALLLFILILPLLLIVSLIIYIDGGFPIIYKQKRIGINNSIFWVYKLRSMKKNIPDIPTHLIKNPEQYYTRSGSLLRKYSIDELPQLINIIEGKMVFVGPRPALHNQDDLIDLRTRVGVHELMPGVTGWAQIRGVYDSSVDDVHNKLKHDFYYIENMSLLLDIKIIFLTVWAVFRGKGH